MTVTTADKREIHYEQPSRDDLERQRREQFTYLQQIHLQLAENVRKVRPVEDGN